MIRISHGIVTPSGEHMETEIYLPSNYLLMNTFRTVVIGVCIAATLFLGMINLLFIGFGVIITGTIIMAFIINDSGKKVGERPLVIPYVSDDKRKIVLANIGNHPALDVKGGINNGNNRNGRFVLQHSRRVDGYKYDELYAIFRIYVINHWQYTMD